MRTPLSIVAASAAFFIPILASALGIQVIVNGQTIVFNDVLQSAWYAPFIQDATEAGIVNGYMDANGKLTGKFGPQNSVTIAEALKIAIESAGYDKGAYSSVIDSGVNHWASAYVSVAQGENFAILDRLDRRAKRAEVAAILTSAFLRENSSTPSGTTFSDVTLATKFAPAIETLARDAIVSGDTDVQGQVLGTFRPLDEINRAEVVKMAMAARAKYGQPGKDRTPVGQAVGETSVVIYRDAGFSPSVLHVKRGTTVTFRNESNTELWVASNPHPAHTDYPEVNSTGMLQPGQEYKFTFTRVGTWGFHNHLKPAETGTVSVEQ